MKASSEDHLNPVKANWRNLDIENWPMWYVLYLVPTTSRSSTASVTHVLIFNFLTLACMH
jgi:hypothetical protein